MVARTVTSKNNLKNLLHLPRSAEMKKVSKFPTCQSYPALPYVTMRITFNIPEFTRERNSHCDVLLITPVRVARLVLDDAIAAIQTSR